MKGGWFSCFIFLFLISVILTLLFIPSFLPRPRFFWFALLRWVRQVIIEQVNHTSSWPRERERRGRVGGRYREGERVGRGIFLSARLAIK